MFSSLEDRFPFLLLTQRPQKQLGLIKGRNGCDIYIMFICVESYAKCTSRYVLNMEMRRQVLYRKAKDSQEKQSVIDGFVRTGKESLFFVPLIRSKNIHTVPASTQACNKYDAPKSLGTVGKITIP